MSGNNNGNLASSSFLDLKTKSFKGGKNEISISINGDIPRKISTACLCGRSNVGKTFLISKVGKTLDYETTIRYSGFSMNMVGKSCKNKESTEEDFITFVDFHGFPETARVVSDKEYITKLELKPDDDFLFRLCKSLSSNFVIVVNELSIVDFTLIDELRREGNVMVVHNLREISESEEFENKIGTELSKISNVEKHSISALDLIYYEEKVGNSQEPRSKHFFIAKDGSEAGEKNNEKVFAYMRDLEGIEPLQTNILSHLKTSLEKTLESLPPEHGYIENSLKWMFERKKEEESEGEKEEEEEDKNKIGTSGVFVFELKDESERPIKIPAYEIENWIHSVKKNGESLKHAYESIRNVREIVIEAVKNCGRALEHASEELKNDEEIVSIAWNDDKRNIRFASEELKNVYTNLKRVLLQKKFSCKYCSVKVRNDYDEKEGLLLSHDCDGKTANNSFFKKKFSSYRILHNGPQCIGSEKSSHLVTVKDFLGECSKCKDKHNKVVKIGNEGKLSKNTAVFNNRNLNFVL